MKPFTTLVSVAVAIASHFQVCAEEPFHKEYLETYEVVVDAEGLHEFIFIPRADKADSAMVVCYSDGKMVLSSYVAATQVAAIGNFTSAKATKSDQRGAFRVSIRTEDFEECFLVMMKEVDGKKVVQKIIQLFGGKNPILETAKEEGRFTGR